MNNHLPNTTNLPPELVYRIPKETIFGLVIESILQDNTYIPSSNIILRTSSSSSTSTTSSLSILEYIRYKNNTYDIGITELRIIKDYINNHKDTILSYITLHQSNYKLQLSIAEINNSLSNILTWLIKNSTILSSSTDSSFLRIGNIGQPNEEEKQIINKEKYYQKQLWRESMRSKAAHTEYFDLVHDLRKEEIEASKPNEIIEYKAQMSIGISLLVVLFSAAILGYILGRAWYGNNSSMVSNKNSIEYYRTNITFIQ